MGSLADREKRRSVVGSMVSEMPKTEVEYKNPTYKVRVRSEERRVGKEC